MVAKIPGIHQYCDGWCERCPYTQRCQIFEQQEFVFPTAVSRDIRNQEFWDNLQEYMTQAVMMIQQVAVQRGIDLDALLESAQAMPDPSDHPLVDAAADYAQLLHDFWVRMQELLPKKEQEWVKKGQLGEKEGNPMGEARRLEDAVYVLRQFQFFLAPKLTRALGALSEQGDLQTEANGLAKIGLLVMDRCLVAWSELWQFFPELREEVITCLEKLYKLRRDTAAAFPNAMKFRRPGFDDGFAV
jgi:hypothetical protein